MTTCLYCEVYDPMSSYPPPYCKGKNHHGFYRGCTCESCNQLYRAVQAGELKGDESTVNAYEASMRSGQ